MKKTVAVALLLSTVCAAIWFARPAQAAPAPGRITPVDNLDLTRYVGRWYEIARFPNRFQKRCAGGVTADYRALPGGKIAVENSCRLANGARELAQGVAHIDSAEPRMNAKLRVRFAPKWVGWLPFVWGRYWVVVLDPEYRYAAVTEPTGKDLWILSRSEHMNDETYDSIVARLRQMGLDTAKLKRTPQP